MFYYNTDKEWEKHGSVNPYFAVLTDEKFDKDNLSKENLDEFFKSGEQHVQHIIATIKRTIDPKFSPNRALDFGCGVGRLVVPLADTAKNVVGIDVSDSMLKEAEKNCYLRSIKNVKFVRTDDSLSLLTGKYNLIHSFIVFQHISARRGYKIIERLIDHLEDGGVAVLHFSYYKNIRFGNLLYFLKQTARFIPLSLSFYNKLRGKSFLTPQMQMNPYAINKLFYLLQKNNISNVHVEFTDSGGELGILVYFQR